MRITLPDLETLDAPATPVQPDAAGASGASPWPVRIDTGWRCLSTPAGAFAAPSLLPADGDWLAAAVPGTVAGAWRAAGRLDIEHAPAFAYDDHWFRVALPGDGVRRLRLHGLATIAEVWLDDTKRLDSDSMFVAHDLDVSLHAASVLTVCFRSLAAALAAKRGRARWRPRLASPPSLRAVRTTLLGHMPGWCPTVQAVGPWRAVELLSAAPDAIEHVDCATRLDGDDGIVSIAIRFLDARARHTLHARLRCGAHATELHWDDAGLARGELRLAQVEKWWPHTHGTPALHALTLELGARDGAAPRTHALGEVGFRTIDVDRGADGQGFALRVNGVPVFCRGACWTSADLVTLTGTPHTLAHGFALAREAGLNLLRVGGTMLYESDAFFEIADRTGVLIWHDFAFANFDYPADAAFVASVEREATQFLARTRRFASLAVVCGGSEVDQQAAMFGLPETMRTQALFVSQLAGIAARERGDAVYVTNSPSGGAWPFSTHEGITHYYGVGAYLRPLDDARRANVRFAAECLAFANVPDDVALDALGTQQTHDPRWKRAVPRDPGAGWDFDDVRDHYLRTLYDVDPARLRYEDAPRYLDLSRAVVADLMREVFAEWRRAGSGCGGGIVWQWQDLRIGAGWGVIDAQGAPKSAYHGLAQAWQPVQLAITDEGLNGLDLHLVNERAEPIAARLDLVCLRDGAVAVASAQCEIDLPARGTQRVSAARCLGQFFDFTHAYRFGPRAHDVTIASLHARDTGARLAEAFHLPDRSARERHDLGMTAVLERTADGWQLRIETQRFARFVQVADRRYRAVRDGFHLSPRVPVVVPLVPRHPGDIALDALSKPSGEVRAINAQGPVFYG